ncbi:MAG: PEP-CTERM sorting domain-containing protein [Bryobacteraceae bacterium]
MRLLRSANVAIGMALLGCLCVPARATSLGTDTLVIGQPALTYTGNCDPFGCAALFGLGVYEQVYSSQAFSGALTISSVAFFNTAIKNGGQPSGGTYTLELSYTTHSPGALDLSNYANNIGAGNEVFYTGTLPSIADQMLSFAGTPFQYDPSQGNLLLTVLVSNPSDTYPNLSLDQAASKTVTSSAYFGTYRGSPISGGNTSGGLVTAFGFTSAAQPGTVPEPGSLYLMLGGGVALIAGIARRRRAAHETGAGAVLAKSFASRP